VALGMVVAGCGGDDDDDAADSNGDDAPAELETVTIMMFPGLVYRTPILLAEQEGFFADHGIEIEEVAQPGNLPGIQGLEATGADAGLFAVSTLAQGWQAGSEVAFFCGSQQFIETSLLAAADSDLPSTEDGDSPEDVYEALSGTTIGIQTPLGSGLHLFFQAAIEAEGVSDVTYINTGVQPPVVTAALANGDVDVIQTSPTTTQQLLESGDAKRLLYMPEENEAYGINYGSAFGAPRAWLDENPELAANFCAAIDEANQFVQDDANADTVEQMIMQDTGVTADVAALVREESGPGFQAEIPEDRFQETLDIFVDLGVLQATPEPTFDAIVVVPEG
jgi:ABC-type nitrate/sulfonate/bicarbonate transport system substrate-binding protein